MSPVGPDNDPATRADMRRVHERLDRLNERLDDAFVQRRDLEPILYRVKDLEDWRTWAMRLVIGAVLLAVVAVVLVNP